MSQYVIIDNIEDGMILAEPVLNKFGQTLMPASAVLYEKHKRLLKTWNVKTISIKSSKTEEESELSPEVLALGKERLDRRMTWTPRNNIEKEIYQASLNYVALQILNKKRNK